jgi:hypothetical protein
MRNDSVKRLAKIVEFTIDADEQYDKDTKEKAKEGIVALLGVVDDALFQLWRIAETLEKKP